VRKRFLIWIPLVFCLFLFQDSQRSNVAPEWTLERNSDSIYVYARDFYGSSFKEIRAETTVKATVGGVAKLFDDISLFTKWINGCKTAYMIKKINDNEGYTYTEIEAGWPVSNRDVITHYVRIQDTLTKNVLITLTGVKDYIPEKDGIVRVESEHGYTKIIPLKNGMVHIIHQLHVDPGGFIPGWLANFFVSDGPLISFQNLRKYLSQNQYKYYTSNDLKEPK
jgi:nitrogen fixation protein